MLKWIRNIGLGLAALGLLFLAGQGAQTVAQNVACYMAQGGASWVASSGCTITIASGGTLNVASGGSLSYAGTVGNVTRGVASATAAVTYVDTGLTAITSCTATVNRSSAPGLSTSMVTWTGTTGQLALYQWKVTASGNATLVASTDTVSIGWACVGA